MKKFLMTALAMLMLCMLTGCPDEAKDDKPESMTFVDNLANPAKEFTINSKLNFEVKFIIPNAMETGMGIIADEVISGKIKKATAAWNKDLTGDAVDMSSTNSTINTAVGGLEFEISLDYTEIAGEITSVTLDFPGSAGLVSVAKSLMAKTYIKKPE
jgi:uncharacterized lipoprotein YehR (DUF1307 family)